jgi:hypothetical protein
MLLNKNIKELADKRNQLITISHKSNYTQPKCHISIELPIAGFSNSSLDLIPDSDDNIFELILHEHALKTRIAESSALIKWLQSRKAPYLITIPSNCREDLHSIVPLSGLRNTVRPFIPSASNSMIT